MALNAARKTLINAEISGKLRCALLKQVRKTRQYYEMNNIVYYKRDIEVKWKGPAQDGPVVFLWHGGFLIKANCNPIQAENLHYETSSTQQITKNQQYKVRKMKL